MKRQVVSENSTQIGGTTCVAWFKLSELISRKEKEKALSLYRLLSHSFEDKAYSLQLEGDILWYLEDVSALEKYSQAAFLYKKEKKLISAVSVYEHLLTLEPENFEFLSKIITLYLILSWKEKFELYYKTIIELCDKGLYTQDQVFNLSSKIIDAVFEAKNKKDASPKYSEEDLLFFASADRKKYAWLLASIFGSFKTKSHKLKDRIKEYCLEKNLDF